MHCSHPPPGHLSRLRRLELSLKQEAGPKCRLLHRVASHMAVAFPELRLIQYDCGKLQTLDLLLQRLKAGQHRVLIFTQMTRMLDVLEAFLSHHGHRYLRLDGTTRVEQRQALMERFNADRRIFCFILSTRSGGLGVNLTGADTVIFYDSDWNPTMDAQAQDRCHRIGQTRDVHIYRLISEKTIEENILKKANQKRLLGDVAIEGGNFTTAFFREVGIHFLPFPVLHPWNAQLLSPCWLHPNFKGRRLYILLTLLRASPCPEQKIWMYTIHMIPLQQPDSLVHPLFAANHQRSVRGAIGSGLLSGEGLGRGLTTSDPCGL